MPRGDARGPRPIGEEPHASRLFSLHDHATQAPERQREFSDACVHEYRTVVAKTLTGTGALESHAAIVAGQPADRCRAAIRLSVAKLTLDWRCKEHRDIT